MPVITDPGEPYFKDGIWGWDAAADSWLPLTVDPATNRLVVNVHGDIEVHQTTPADMLVGAHGWDGGNWRRLPLVFGFSSPWMESLNETKDGDGLYAADTTTVPAGEIWILQAVTFYNNTGQRGRVMIWLRGCSNYMLLAYHLTPLRYEPVALYSEIILTQGDSIRIHQTDCLDNDLLLAEVRGYKMLITA